MYNQKLYTAKVLFRYIATGFEAELKSQIAVFVFDFCFGCLVRTVGFSGYYFRAPNSRMAIRYGHFCEAGTCRLCQGWAGSPYRDPPRNQSQLNGIGQIRWLRLFEVPNKVIWAILSRPRCSRACPRRLWRLFVQSKTIQNGGPIFVRCNWI